MRDPKEYFNTLPTEYQNLLRLAQEKFSIEIIPLQELKGGRTGAHLFLVSVSVSQSNNVQHLVLKLDHKNKKTKTDELERHSTAFSQSPSEFSGNHIAKVAFERIELDDAVAIFYSIAGHSLHNYKSLANHQHQNKLEKIFEKTNELLLAEWNKHPEFERAVHPQKIISKWLGYRLKPGGNIDLFLENTCGIPNDTQGFMIQGNVFPNPLIYSRESELWFNARPIDTIVGFQHGDLNIGNILVEFSETDNELTGYYLIDFALFKTSMPLFYDLCYLEMSYLIRELSRVSYTKWIDLVTRFAQKDFIDPHQVPIELSGTCSVINKGRNTFGKLIKNLFPSLADDLRGQYWLAAAAAGLNFCNKTEIPDKERQAGLIFAAVHLKRYHTTFGVPLPVEIKYLHMFDQSGDNETAGAQVTYAKKAKHNLPFQASAFIGRHEQVKEITQLLQRKDVHLVTLTGPGGTGKTRLALRTAQEVIENFRDGVHFVDLSQIHDPESVLVSIAGALGLRESSNQPVVEEIKTKLQTKDLLLMLDNFEHVISAAERIGELLPECPGLKLLITSREALKLRGEYIYPVPPLGLPHTDIKQQSPEEIIQYEAVKLFISRAVTVKPDFQVTNENAPAIAEICLRLDGLPLAIELAVGRINLFKPEELLKRLNGRLNLLRGGPRDLPARQRTLRDTISWSYEMLNTFEQQLFSLFSVFAGCTFESLENITEKIPEIDNTHFNIIDGITSLIDKGLIRRADESNGESRLMMLETIREYASESLYTFPGLAESTKKIHALYFAEFAQKLLSGLHSSARESTLNKAEHEIENMKIAWRYWVSEKNPEQLHKLTDTLWLIYDSKGWYYAALDLTADLLNVLAGSPSSRERALQEIMLQTSLAKVLMSIKGCTPEVEKVYKNALELCKKYGEIPQLFPVLKALGGFYAYTADFEKSSDFGKQIINLGEENNDISIKIEGMLLYGYSLVFSGNPKEGIKYLEGVITHYNYNQHNSHSFRMGNNAGVTSHTTTALCLWMLGFPDRALKFANDSITLAERLKHPYSLAYALFHTGLFHLWRQEYTIALDRANAALKTAEKHEFQIWKAVAVCLHGSALAALGQTEKGLDEINQGVSMYNELRTPPVFWPILLTLQAGTYVKAGQPAEALIYIDEAITTIGEGTENPMLAEIYRLKGEILLMISKENQEAAGTLFQRALDLAEKQQTRMFQLRVAISINNLWKQKGNSGEYRQILKEAYSKFTEGFNTADLIEAQRML